MLVVCKSNVAYLELSQKEKEKKKKKTKTESCTAEVYNATCERSLKQVGHHFLEGQSESLRLQSIFLSIDPSML